MLSELASLAEGHFHVQLDVAGLAEDERLAWERRVSSNEGPLSSPCREYRRPFWLLAGGRRVGTLAIDTLDSGRDLLSLSSLYVAPAERRRNLARGALEAVLRVGTAHGAAGLRLDANWTWQPAVRFYARIGMWVSSWKHNLVFTWQQGLPPYRVEIDGDQACFLIRQDERWRTAVTARNLGNRLCWETEDREDRAARDLASWCIPGTLAVHLALAGWPLVRSEENWAARYNWSDAGEPEGLAYKIEIFEAVARQRGFIPRTPRIPGLQYRDLEEIE